MTFRGAKKRNAILFEVCHDLGGLDSGMIETLELSINAASGSDSR